MKGHPELAGALLGGLQMRGFDPAFCLKEDNTPEIGHAFMRPAESITDFDMPIVPVMTNCYFAPQLDRQALLPARARHKRGYR